jgi:DNA-binding HxlR family transcriptional regulator
MPIRHPYRQYCPVATGLDLVGERWSLLIVRDLAAGPRRFRQLARSLPGVAHDVLADRLRTLTTAGVADRVESGYALTEDGRGLLPAIRALAEWGAGRMGPPPSEMVEPAWRAITALVIGFDPAAAAGVDLVIRLRVDDESATLHVRDCDYRPTTREPRLTLTTSVAAVFDPGRVPDSSPFVCTQQGLDPGLGEQALSLFRLPGPGTHPTNTVAQMR